MPTPRLCPSCGAALASGAQADGLCAVCLLDSALLEDSAGGDDVSSTDLASGSIFATFRIVRLLGKGGMASVYEAYDARLDRAVAIKVLPPQFLHDETFARRFQQEARLVARLSHPHIVPVYATGIEQGVPWMAMRLLTGGSVGQLLAASAFRQTDHDEPLAIPVVLDILRDVGSALDYAHAAGVIHRDVKPTNILLDEDHRASLSDFGLARMLDGGRALTRMGSIAGTPQYMSPEQALGLEVDHRSDLYSLGVVAYELLTGRVPFDDEAPLAVLLKHVNDPVPSPSGRDVPPQLLRVVSKALAKRPSDRWASSAGFVAALHAAVEANEPRSHLKGTSPILLTLGAIVVSGSVLAIYNAKRESPAAPPVVVADPVSEAPDQRLASAALPAPSDDVPVGPSRGPVSRPARNATSELVEPRSPIASVSVNAHGVSTPAGDPGDSTVREPGDGAAASVDATPSPLADTAPVAEPPASARVVEPVRVSAESAVYPPLARAADIQGEVRLVAHVGPDGTVTQVDVVQAPHPLLADAARKAVLRYRYTPGSRNGAASAFQVPVTIRFRLQ